MSFDPKRTLAWKVASILWAMPQFRYIYVMILLAGERRSTMAVVLEAAMKRDDAGYYRRRALQEQVAAQKATCSAARERHDELAMIYRFRAAMLSTGPDAWEESPPMTVDAV